MPPRIPIHVSRRSVHAITPINGALCARSFTSTAPSLALGPESPNYIEVPQPKQPTFPPTPRIKGVLPTPRDVFKTRNPAPKESKAFIDASTTEPKKLKVPGPHSKDAEYRLYKQRLADSRRKALRGGIKELYERKTVTEAATSASREASAADKQARIMAPPREVDVLTQTTISKGVRDFLADALPSTSRSNISNDRRARYARKMEKHDAARQTHLHDLYVNAREFIVSEEQLDQAIEKEFGTEQHPMGWDQKGNMGPGFDGQSVWSGPVPEGSTEKRQQLKGGAGVGLAKDRMKRLAEELTGGKM